VAYRSPARVRSPTVPAHGPSLRGGRAVVDVRNSDEVRISNDPGGEGGGETTAADDTASAKARARRRASWPSWMGSSARRRASWPCWQRVIGSLEGKLALLAEGDRLAGGQACPPGWGGRLAGGQAGPVGTGWSARWRASWPSWMGWSARWRASWPCWMGWSARRMLGIPTALDRLVQQQPALYLRASALSLRRLSHRRWSCACSWPWRSPTKLRRRARAQRATNQA